MLSVGVDIGGTFTDVVCRDADGRLSYFKLPTTRKDESLAVLEAVEQIVREHSGAVAVPKVEAPADNFAPDGFARVDSFASTRA